MLFEGQRNNLVLSATVMLVLFFYFIINVTFCNLAIKEMVKATHNLFFGLGMLNFS